MFFFINVLHNEKMLQISFVFGSFYNLIYMPLSGKKKIKCVQTDRTFLYSVSVSTFYT